MPTTKAAATPAAASVTLSADEVAALEKIVGDAPASPADPSAVAITIGATVDAWFNQTVLNSPVARSVEAYNHLLSSIPALKEALATALA